MMSMGTNDVSAAISETTHDICRDKIGTTVDCGDCIHLKIVPAAGGKFSRLQPVGGVCRSRRSTIFADWK